jgi:transposase
LSHVPPLPPHGRWCKGRIVAVWPLPKETAAHRAPWADIPARYGPHTTCLNHFNRWRKAGVWDRILSTVSKACDGDIQMIDCSSIRVHQHAANLVAI